MKKKVVLNEMVPLIYMPIPTQILKKCENQKKQI